MDQGISRNTSATGTREARPIAQYPPSSAGTSAAALVPAEDGGYCAIGLASRVPVAEVFREIPWSTDAVLSATLHRLEDARLPHRVLEAAYDVDLPEDVDRLRRDLAGRDPDAEDFPAATARALAALAAGPRP